MTACFSPLSADLISCLEKGNDFTEAEFRYALCARTRVNKSRNRNVHICGIRLCVSLSLFIYSKFCPAGCLTDFGEVSGTIPHGYRDVRALTCTHACTYKPQQKPFDSDCSSGPRCLWVMTSSCLGCTLER